MPEPEKQIEIVWKPFKGPQSDFLASTAKRVLFGGALGPGKTDALMADPIRYIQHPHFQALFLRRTYSELGECMERAYRRYKKIGMTWEHDGSKWRMSGGGFIEYGHCQHQQDWSRYLTKEYQKIYFDQLETFEEDMITNIWSRCRSTVSEISSQIKCTANPGGISHLFIKQRWPDRCPIRPRDEEKYIPEVYPQLKEIDLWWQPMESAGAFVDEFGISWEYHPAIVFDNPILVEKDPNYIRTLLSYDQKKRDAWLWGKWDIPMGQFFSEWDYKVHAEHTLGKIPFTSRGLISLDWATRGVFFAVVLIVDHNADVWAIDEFYCEGESTEYKAEHIDRLIEKHPYVEVLVVPRDMNKEVHDREAERTQTQLEIFLDFMKKDIYVAQADMTRGSRVRRLDLIRGALNWKNHPPWLRFIGKKQPNGLGCPKLVETLPTIQHHPNLSLSDEIDPKGWNHGVDSLSYGLDYIRTNWHEPLRVPKDAYDVAREQQRYKKKQLHWLVK